MLSIDDALKAMNLNRAAFKEKGTFGELAVLGIIQELKEKYGGFIYHSFAYPYKQKFSGEFYKGNVHLENGKFVEVPSHIGMFDEIDILYVSKYKVFAIEVKARTGTWKLFDYWCTQNGRNVDKYPVHQSEKHARHLYHSIYEYLPMGDPRYIVPMSIFVDKAKIVDSRNNSDRAYLPVGIANNTKNRIVEYNRPFEHALDINALQARLNQIGKGTLYR